MLCSPVAKEKWENHQDKEHVTMYGNWTESATAQIVASVGISLKHLYYVETTFEKFVLGYSSERMVRTKTSRTFAIEWRLRLVKLTFVLNDKK